MTLPSPSSSATATPPRLNWRGRLATAALLILVLLLLAIVAVWGYLRFHILPRIDTWRAPLEQHATQALGIKVEIGALRSLPNAWEPEVEMQDLRLVDPQGRVALHLPRVDAKVSWLSLWPGAWLNNEVRLSRLRIDAPELSVRVDAQGHWWIAGLKLGGPAAAAQPSGLDWLLTQPEIRIEHGQLHWLNQSVQGERAQEVLLRELQLRLRNTGWLLHRHHVMELSATPPSDWGQPFAINVNFSQPRFTLRSVRMTAVSDWSTWRGTTRVSLPRVDLALLRDQVELPWDLHSGSGSINAQMSLKRGQWQGAEAMVSLHNVRMRFEPALDELGLQQLQGRFIAQRLPSGKTESIHLQAQNFSFQTTQGLVWPTGNLQLSWQQPQAPTPGQGFFAGLHFAAAHELMGGDLLASDIDMGVLTALSTRVPISATLRDMLVSLDVHGLAHDIKLEWQGPPQEPRSYTVSGQIKQLKLAAALTAPATSASAAGAGSATMELTTAPALSSSAAEAPAAAPSAEESGRPGIDNAQITFQANQDGGKAQVQITQGAVVFPGVFETPRIDLDRLSAQLQWAISKAPAAKAGQPNAPPQISLKITDAQFANADTEGHLEASWHTGAAEGTGRGAYLPGVLQLHGELTRADATKVARYLPISIPEHTRHYVAQATRSGKATHVGFTVNGDLWDVPFGQAGASDGQFSIVAQIADANFCYAPPVVLGAAPTTAASKDPVKGKDKDKKKDTDIDCSTWPMFTQMSGELVFDKQSMLIHHAQARLGTLGSGQLLLRDVEGHIDHLDHFPVLSIQGDLQGDLSDVLLYVQSTPINTWTQGFLAQAQGSAATQVHLDLHLTLDDLDQSQVQGRIAWGGNNLRFGPQLPWLQALKGQVDFTQTAVQVHASARVLGGDAKIEGGSQSDGSIRISATGGVSAQGLRQALEASDKPMPSAKRSAVAAPSPSEWEHLGRLAQHMNGQTTARFVLSLVNQQSSWSLTSDMQGMGLDLPAPFNKPAQQISPLRLENTPLSMSPEANATTRGAPPAANPKANWDAVRLSWGDALQVQLIRDVSTDAPRIVRGAIGVNTPARLGLSGINAQLNLNALDADAWIRLAHALDSSPAPALPAGPSRLAASGAALGSFAKALDTVALRCKSLTLAGRQWSNVRLDARQVAASSRWHVDLNADQARGQVDWISPPEPNAPSIVQARLSRLVVPKTLVSLSSEPGTPATNTGTTTWPDLDISIEDLGLGELKLGKLDVQAQNRADASGRPIWQINKLGLSLPEARLSASGLASLGSASIPPKTSLDFNLDLNNSGALLTRFGQAQTLKGGKGKINGQVQWTGSMLSFDAPSLSGKLHLSVEAGQFLRVDPGAAKLLGVLSLQSLPRRLALDFRDIFLQGFAFDHIDGDVDIVSGVASTRNMRMSGVQAVIFMEGQADVRQETQDVHVWVLPEINAATASLAYAAINPALGLGTFLAQMFLRKPMIEANTREFRITGSWKDPQVQRIAHRAGSTPIEATKPSSAVSSGAAAVPSPTSPNTVE